ncbi:hypothetical protein Bca4012_075694 [Brassica carinata]|uniref:Uncharacterized protein n=1 Tax=Brassica carinata TaxID=52824 RepID=A0A8X7QAX6_BRACI|nr:hypothetical protein Bca52824_073904 [Brassica carinata]
MEVEVKLCLLAAAVRLPLTTFLTPENPAAKVEANRMREITTGGDEEKRNGGEELDGDVVDLLTDGIGRW